MNNQEETKVKEIGIPLYIVILIFIVLISILTFYIRNTHYKKTDDNILDNNEIDEIKVDETKITDAVTKKMLQLQELKKENNDIVAWIHIFRQRL